MKVIICDLDGTLCESREHISVRIGKLISKLAKKYLFVIITGGNWDRYPEQVFDRLDDCAIHCFSSMGNEYKVFKKKNNKMYLKSMYENTLNDVQKFGIKFAMNCLKDHFPKLTTEAFKFEDKGGSVTFSGTGKNAPKFIKQDFDPLCSVRKEWVSKLREEKLLPFDVCVKIGGTTSLDFMLKDSGKRQAVEYFLSRKKIKPENTLYIGDAIFEDGNDEDIIGCVPYKKVKTVNQTYKILRDLL